MCCAHSTLVSLQVSKKKVNYALDPLSCAHYCVFSNCCWYFYCLPVKFFSFIRFSSLYAFLSFWILLPSHSIFVLLDLSTRSVWSDSFFWRFFFLMNLCFSDRSLSTFYTWFKWPLYMQCILCIHCILYKFVYVT